MLAALSDSDRVLDIGGWACPFNRADFVMDAQPYETRGYYGRVGGLASQGGERERFTRDTWIVRDICDHEPFPFADKSLDFVICSHTLEDIRDPLWVCREMIRVAKRGYLEVPSRVAESCRGWESPRIAGLSHHRWLIDIAPDPAAVKFTMKYHMIHADRRLSLPPHHFAELTEEQRVSWLFWTDSFTVEEVTIHGLDAIRDELAGFVWKHENPRSALAAAGRAVRSVGQRFGRLWHRMRRGGR